MLARRVGLFLSVLLAGGAAGSALAPVANAATTNPPDVVRSLTGSTTASTLTLSWQAPAVSSSHSAATSYQVLGSSVGNCASIPVRTVTSTKVTITGLTHRCKITMVVWAHNAGGDGTPKKYTLTTKDAPTGAVQGLTPIVIDGAVRLKWRAPATKGESAPLGYRVTAMTGASVLVVETVGILGVDLPRMPAHVVVAFMVTPINAAGAGTPDIVTAVPGISIRPVGSARPSVKAGSPFTLQVKIATAFGGIPLGRDAIEVLARHGNSWVRVGRLLTAINGVATFHGLVRSPAQVVLRPASHSIQGVLFRVAVHS